MSLFKNNPFFKLYYTDTDSIFIDKSPEELNKIIAPRATGIVNDKELQPAVGKMKLEYAIKKLYFLDLNAIGLN